MEDGRGERGWKRDGRGTQGRSGGRWARQEEDGRAGREERETLYAVGPRPVCSGSDGLGIHLAYTVKIGRCTSGLPSARACLIDQSPRANRIRVELSQRDKHSRAAPASAASAQHGRPISSRGPCTGTPRSRPRSPSPTFAISSALARLHPASRHPQISPRFPRQYSTSSPRGIPAITNPRISAFIPAQTRHDATILERRLQSIQSTGRFAACGPPDSPLPLPPPGSTTHLAGLMPCPIGSPSSRLLAASFAPSCLDASLSSSNSLPLCHKTQRRLPLSRSPCPCPTQPLVVNRRAHHVPGAALARRMRRALLFALSCPHHCLLGPRTHTIAAAVCPLACPPGPEPCQASLH